MSTSLLPHTYLVPQSLSRWGLALLVLVATPPAIAQTCTPGSPNPVQWKDIVGVTVNTDQTISGKGGAASINRLEAGVDGWVEFTAKPSWGAAGFTLGLSYINADASHATTDYGFYYEGGYINTYEQSTNLGNAGTAAGSVAEGDVLRIAREGAFIKYYKNGVSLRSVAAVASKTMLVEPVRQLWEGSFRENLVLSSPSSGSHR